MIKNIIINFNEIKFLEINQTIFNIDDSAKILLKEMVLNSI